MVMIESKEKKNTGHKEINMVPGREPGHMIFSDQVGSGSSPIAKASKAAACDDLHGIKNPQQAASLLEEWQKWLLHSVNVNVYGNNIPGVLTQVHPDHITVVGESQVFVIPIQHVAFICYKIK